MRSEIQFYKLYWMSGSHWVARLVLAEIRSSYFVTKEKRFCILQNYSLQEESS